MSSGILGSGDFAYQAQDGWAKWPEGWDSGDVATVDVDRWDNVYAFNCGLHPMVVFDREGNVLRSWGEGVFKNAHGVYMGADDAIYLTDDGDHTMRKCTLDGNARGHKYSPDGKWLFSWGGPGTRPGEFNIAHNITCDADGWVYVGEVAYVSFSRSFPNVPKPARIRCLQKLVKVKRPTHYSGCIPASLTILPKRAYSLFISAVSSCGPPGNKSKP